MKNIKIILLIYVLVNVVNMTFSFPFGNKKADDYIVDFKNIVIKLEVYEEELDFSQLDFIAQQKENIDGQRKNIKLKNEQILIEEDLIKRYEKSYSKLINYKNISEYFIDMETLVIRVEGLAEAGDFSRLNYIEKEKSVLNEKRKNIKLVAEQQEKENEYLKRYEIAYAKLLNLYKNDASFIRKVERTSETAIDWTKENVPKAVDFLKKKFDKKEEIKE